MMDEDVSGHRDNTIAQANVSVSNDNARRGDYFVLGFIGILLAGVAAYLLLNPEESTLRDGKKIEKSSAHKPVHESMSPRTVAHESATPEHVESASVSVAPTVVKPEVTKQEVVKPEAVKPEVVKPEVVKPEVVKPEVVKPEVVKPEVVKPEVVKPEVVKPEAVTPVETQPAAASASGHENMSRENRTVWAVNLVSFSRLDAARQAMAQLKGEGIATEVIEVMVSGHKYYRVRIPGLASRQEAVRLRAEFVNRPEYAGVWISPYRKSDD